MTDHHIRRRCSDLPNSLEDTMKSKYLLWLFALLLTVSFTSVSFAQDKEKQQKLYDRNTYEQIGTSMKILDNI